MAVQRLGAHGVVLGERRRQAAGRGLAGAVGRAVGAGVDHDRQAQLLGRRVHRLVNGGAKSLAKTVSDRKSTRLNSSHQIISYAVFCLKKKKKTTDELI